VTDCLYLRDAYLRRFEAIVTRSGPDGVELDATAFYPTGGGQPSDTGWLAGEAGSRWRVVGVEKIDGGGVAHRIEGETRPEVGTRVRAGIDWNRRYTHMRYHTCVHILSGVVYRRFGSGITGGQISEDRARVDFSLPEFRREVADELVAEATEVVRKSLPVHVRFLPRTDAEKDPSLVRVARELMPDVSEVRLIDIGGFDVQADGGTHVRSTAELGDIRLERFENKGARNRRLYVTLGPPPAGESGSSGSDRPRHAPRSDPTGGEPHPASPFSRDDAPSTRLAGGSNESGTFGRTSERGLAGGEPRADRARLDYPVTAVLWTSSLLTETSVVL
jgi:misacylated tRNA(Ala) deacylase